MKNMLTALVFLCCTGAGLRASLRLQRKCREIESLAADVRKLTLDVRYGERKLCGALRECGTDLLLQVAEGVEKGESPGESWQKAAEGKTLDKGIRAELDGFFATLGSTDKTGQLEALQRISAVLDDGLEKARQAAEKKAKLRISLGVLVGATAVVMML